MRSAVAIIGMALLTTGCWLAWAPLGYIVPGLVLLTAAVAGHWRSKP